MRQHIAALYVEEGGVYYDLEIREIDQWSEKDDARKYGGPYPVVAHPPCNRWSRLCYMLKAVHNFKIGDDGGCFKRALECVREYGGVLEHPAHSLAWKEFRLLRPQGAQWTRSLFDEGWVCEIDQAYYGHPAGKPTWLYAVGCELPKWDLSREKHITHQISRLGKRVQEGELKRLRDAKASATPPAFRDILIDMARSVKLGKK